MYKIFAKNKKGFTLIELIVVIAILAILAAIAIPTFSGITSEADAKVDLANARNLATAINAYNNLNPGSEISSMPELASLKSTLGNIFPTGLADADATTAMGLITITSNVATAAESATSTPAPTD